jgi:hypothetical protein
MYSPHTFPGTKEDNLGLKYTMRSKQAYFQVTDLADNCHTLYLHSFYGVYQELLTLLEKLAIWAGNSDNGNYTNFYLANNSYNKTLQTLIEKCKFKKCGVTFTNKRTTHQVATYTVDINTLLKTIKELK